MLSQRRINDDRLIEYNNKAPSAKYALLPSLLQLIKKYMWDPSAKYSLSDDPFILSAEYVNHSQSSLQREIRVTQNAIQIKFRTSAFLNNYNVFIYNFTIFRTFRLPPFFTENKNLHHNQFYQNKTFNLKALNARRNLFLFTYIS